MQTVNSIIDMLGGTGRVAEALDLADPSVSSWRARDSIPAAYWLRLIRLGAAQGKVIDLTGLAKHARPKHRVRRQRKSK